MGVKGRDMFTAVGSECVLLLLTAVLKLLILVYLKGFAKGTSNGWERFGFVFPTAAATEERMLWFDI